MPIETEKVYDRMRDAIHFMVERFPDHPDLESLGERYGVSPIHFQKQFTQWAGVSPKRFQQFLDRNRALGLLREGSSVFDATYSGGWSSPARLHDLTVQCDALTPGEVRQGGLGVQIQYGAVRTPFGWAVAAFTARGLCGFVFVDEPAPTVDAQSLIGDWPRAHWVSAQTEVQARVDSMFSGAQPWALHLRGTNFQIKVWEALLRIPVGQVCSYTDVAQAIGRPSSVRAVASAIGANRVAVLIPCHRVLRESGVLAGYRWGTERKALLLASEHAQGLRASTPTEAAHFKNSA